MSRYQLSAVPSLLCAGLVLALPALVVSPSAAHAQDVCEQRYHDNDWERVCEERNLSFAADGALDLDAGMNGGIEIRGTNRADISIVAEVWAHSRSEARSQEIIDDIEIEMRNGRLRATGPSQRRRESWGVSWHVETPVDMDLDLTTHNGGIKIAGVEGEVRFEALNGGVRLDRVAGDVRGKTINGGLDVVLAGQQWDGRGLDVVTTNGGVEVTIPEGYSADFETGTVNGRMDLEIPMTVRGRVDRSIRAQLGDGGPPVRARTTNGSVTIRAGR